MSCLSLESAGYFHVLSRVPVPMGELGSNLPRKPKAPIGIIPIGSNTLAVTISSAYSVKNGATAFVFCVQFSISSRPIPAQ